MNSFPIHHYRVASIEELNRLGIPEREKFLMKVAQEFFDERNTKEAVYIGKNKDDALCLERDGILVSVYFSERGGKNLIALFSSIYDAFDFLAARCLSLPRIPLDWISINKDYDLSINPASSPILPPKNHA